MRVSDVDRQRVAKQVEKAHAEGRLDLAEFDERTGQVWAARTYRELAAVTADLPEAAIIRPPDQPRAPAPVHSGTVEPAPRRTPARRRGGKVAKVVVGAWATASFVNLVIWGVLCITTGHLHYFWPLWVAGPWGAVILAGYMLGIGRPRQD